MALHNPFFYHDQLRKYITAFGTLFNNIHVQRKNDSGDKIQLEKVPLTYAPKSRWIYKINQDPQLSQQPAIKLPRMAFELDDVERDESRSHHSTKRLPIDKTQEKFTNTYMPVPYNLQFTLTIGSKTKTELFQIAEQIIPFFDPDYAISVRVFEDGTSFDIPIEYGGTDKDDNYEDGFEERRAITWTFNFTMKTWIFGPVNKTEVIREVINEFYWLDTSELLYTVTIQPTLGDGTPIEDIKPSDDFGIDEDVTY